MWTDFIALGLSMPPLASATVSTVTLIVVFFLGRIVLGRITTQGAAVQQNFVEQNTTLNAIKEQTTETNGRVIKLETWAVAHNELDDVRFDGVKTRVEDWHKDTQAQFEKMRKDHERLIRTYETTKAKLAKET